MIPANPRIHDCRIARQPEPVNSGILATRAKLPPHGLILLPEMCVFGAECGSDFQIHAVEIKLIPGRVYDKVRETPAISSPHFARTELLPTHLAADAGRKADVLRSEILAE